MIEYRTCKTILEKTVKRSGIANAGSKMNQIEGAPQEAETQSRKAETMSGLAKGLAIIEAFAAKPALTIADAAKASATTRAAARRCLFTLCDCGYVEFDGKFYRPLPRLLGLGGGISRALPLPQMAQPFLEQIRDALEESVSLAVLDGKEVLFIARAEASRIVSTGVRVGTRLPAFTSATGRVLLAALPPKDMQAMLTHTELRRRTPKTLVEHDAVAKAILDVRRQAYALGDEELELGLCAIALPVIDRAGRTVAAISVSASSARIGPTQMRNEFLPVMRRNAEELSKLL
jgi:IclR family transcriptional regulator, pca regulon regulatory protein